MYLKLTQNVITTWTKRYIGLPPVPYKLNLFVTNLCNLKCRTCKIWQLHPEKPELKKKELSHKEWDEFFKKNGKSIFWLSLSGGEPFIRSDLSKIAISALEDCRNLSILSINTNGFLTEKIIDDIKKILKNTEDVQLIVSISLDGFQQTHNYIRHTKDAYKQASKTHKLLSKLQNQYKCLIVERELTLSKFNVTEIPLVVKTLKTPFVLTFAHRANFYNNEGDDVLVSYDSMKDKLSEIKIPLHRKEDFIKMVFFKLAKAYLKDKKQPLPCYSSWASVTINPYGDVYPCIILNEKLGNLRENNYNLSEILQSKKTKEVQRKIKKGECPSCWTPCEAYTSIIQNFPLAMIKYLYP